MNIDLARSVLRSLLRLGPFLAFTTWALSSLHNRQLRFCVDVGYNLGRHAVPSILHQHQ